MRRHEIIKTFDPPIQIAHKDYDKKAFAHYIFIGSGDMKYYCMDIYESDGKPYEYKNGSWYVEHCLILDSPITNKLAVQFLEKED